MQTPTYNNVSKYISKDTILVSNGHNLCAINNFTLLQYIKTSYYDSFFSLELTLHPSNASQKMNYTVLIARKDGKIILERNKKYRGGDITQVYNVCKSEMEKNCQF